MVHLHVDDHAIGSAFGDSDCPLSDVLPGDVLLVNRAAGEPGQPVLWRAVLAIGFEVVRAIIPADHQHDWLDTC